MPSHYLRKTEGRLCEWCRERPAMDNHHLVHRSRGGTDRGYTTDQDAISEDGNIVQLCEVCHQASHGIYATDSTGFNCRACPLLPYCDAGRILIARKGVIILPPT
jgi:hypothetical protein